MKNEERKKLTREWQTILESHPRFARSFLTQQAVLIEAAELGVAMVERSMCQLLKSGHPVLFADYWAERCSQRVVREVEIGGMIGCLSETNRDPARCFDTDPEGWFDDPFADERVLPPRPPIPPL